MNIINKTQNNRQKELIKEFKNSLKNKDLLPHYDEKYGTKYDGIISSLHFYLYAVIRLSKVEKAFHNMKKFDGFLGYLRRISKNENDSYQRELNHLKKVFPSLTTEDLAFFIKNYKENITYKNGE